MLLFETTVKETSHDLEILHFCLKAFERPDQLFIYLMGRGGGVEVGGGIEIKMEFTKTFLVESSRLFFTEQSISYVLGNTLLS